VFVSWKTPPMYWILPGRRRGWNSENPLNVRTRGAITNEPINQIQREEKTR
jgi:hypothetical protein